MGFQLLQPAARRLIRADGKEMDCIGTCDIKLQLGEVKHAVEVAVVRQLNGPLLSWHDCICLGILPITFPQQICAVERQPATKLTVSRRSRDQDEALVSLPMLGFFDPTRRTVLETDAVRVEGLGFCLRQQDEHNH